MKESARILLLQQDLLKWYRKYKRKLPWRETKDPYAIWVSEIMLQQTRVDTVIDYYHRFLKKFPTIAVLAKSSEQDVLKQWQGLGYYRRAKMIHKAAKDVSQNYGGKLPATRDALQKLPGFGPYTSGAVASIAFDKPVPAVDGNVKRVLSRVFATHESVDPIALQAAQNDSPSDWTQALMELGALICIPKNPKCLVCPVQKNCKAYETSSVEKYPLLIKKAKAKEVFAVTWMIQDLSTKKILIQKRPENGRWSNMWEFPTDEFDKKPTTVKHGSEKIGSFKHLLTHQTIHIDVVALKIPKNESIAKHQQWIELNELDQFPISKMQLRAFEIYIKKSS